MNDMDLMKYEINEAVNLCNDEGVLKLFEALAFKMITPERKRKRTVEEKAARAKMYYANIEDVAD